MGTRGKGKDDDLAVRPYGRKLKTVEPSRCVAGDIEELAVRRAEREKEKERERE